MPKKVSQRKRLSITELGPVYKLLLNADAWRAGRTPNEQAKSLLQARLQARSEMIREEVKEIAGLCGIDPEELWRRVSSGEEVELEGFPESVREPQSPSILGEAEGE